VHNPALDFLLSRPEGGNDGAFLELGLKGIAGILIDTSRRGRGSSWSRPGGAAVRAFQECCI